LLVGLAYRPTVQVDWHVPFAGFANKTMLLLLVQDDEQRDVIGSAYVPVGQVSTHILDDESPKVPTQVETHFRVKLSAKKPVGQFFGVTQDDITKFL